jgi:hypothetical protein
MDAAVIRYPSTFVREWTVERQTVNSAGSTKGMKKIEADIKTLNSILN